MDGSILAIWAKSVAHSDYSPRHKRFDSPRATRDNRGVKVTEIQALIKGEAVSDPETLEHYSHDTSLFEVKPSVVIYPKDADDLATLVGYAAKHPGELTLTPRSGGTDMTGGPLTEGAVVDVGRHMDRLISIEKQTAIVESGVYYRDFERETLKHDLLLPCYPASREICMLGGMVANNSGGEKTLSYGKILDYVEELEVVLADGERHTLKPLSEKELAAKMEAGGFEGELYGKLSKLIKDNYDLLQRAKPKVSKNSSGYYLWDVWDPEQKTFDLTKLIVGSQGTLGIVTQAKLRLIRPEPEARMLVIFLKNLDDLAGLIPEVLSHRPESFESYDDHTLKLAMRYLPEIARQMHGDLWTLIRSFGPEMRMILTGGMPKLVLMAEFTGESVHDVQSRAEAAQTELARKFPHLKMGVTHSKRESKKYWVVRRESFNLLRKHLRHKHTAPFIDDLCVRPDQLTEFLPELSEIMSHYKLVYTIAGHIGDANFHIIPLMDLRDPRQRAIIPELEEKVYRLVFKYGGTMSGEHNDGLIRSPYLPEMFGSKVYRLFEETKQIMDPQGIFNPGKKVHASQEYAMRHMIRE